MKVKSPLHLKSLKKYTLIASAALLTACGSGGGSSNDVGSNLNDVNISTVADQQVSENNSGASNGNLAGSFWVACNDAGGLRSDYEFTGSTYINRVGSGNCNGFEPGFDPLTNAGPYSITGTAMSSSGLTAFVMELTTETINGFPVFQSLLETRRRLVYTGTEGEIVFSNSDARDGQELDLELNFSIPFSRVR